MVQCSVPSCTNRSDCQGWKKRNANNDNIVKITFHRLPKNPTILCTWLELLGMSSSIIINKNARICSVHFEEECFDRTTDRTRLRPNKLPKNILTTNQDSLVKSSVSDENPIPVFQETNIFSLQPSTSAETSTISCADDFPNMCDISRLPATQPSGLKFDKGMMVDCSIIFNSLEKSRLRERIRYLMAGHKKKMKLAKHDLKRKNDQIVKFKSILNTMLTQ